LGNKILYWVINGVKYDTAKQAAEENGVSVDMLYRRCRGYYRSDGVFTPPKPGYSQVREDEENAVAAPPSGVTHHTVCNMEIQIPMPTWNRVLSMHHYERKKLRDMIHGFVEQSVTGKINKELSIDKYLSVIRPSEKNKAAAKQSKPSQYAPKPIERPKRKADPDERYALRFVHYRKRKVDPDNLSTKAFIDGVVRGGILPDDTAKYIDSIGHSQVLILEGENERTIMRIVASVNSGPE